jgi:DNA anti-recombination protein RmuC
MLDGLSYLIAQVALLLLIAIGVGVVLGHLLWPRRAERPATGPVIAPGMPPTGPAPDDTELARELDQARNQLAQLHHRLATADSEVLRMRAQAQALADEKEAEMGRLESGAITALEQTIAKHQERVTGLEFRVRTAEEATRNTESMLDAERRRTAQLQAALAERDQHVATLSADLAATPRPAGPTDANPAGT